MQGRRDTSRELHQRQLEHRMREQRSRAAAHDLRGSVGKRVARGELAAHHLNQRDRRIEVRATQAEGRSKRHPLIHVTAFDRSGIFDAPMGGHRLTRPVGTHFAGCVVADGEYEIEMRRARLGELVPALAAQPLARQAHFFEQCERNGMHLTLGVTAWTEAAKFAPAPGG